MTQQYLITESWSVLVQNKAVVLWWLRLALTFAELFHDEGEAGGAWVQDVLVLWQAVLLRVLIASGASVLYTRTKQMLRMLTLWVTYKPNVFWRTLQTSL